MLDINVILAVLLMAGGTNANDELIVVLASPDISDEVSSAKLTSSATRVSNSTGSFTVCIRFKLRMVPEFGYYARLGEEIEKDHRKGPCTYDVCNIFGFLPHFHTTSLTKLPLCICFWGTLPLPVQTSYVHAP